MSEQELKVDSPPERLCSEVQLFDLCDREQCNRKKGRFCGDPDMLTRFEKIAEDDELSSPLVYVEGEEGEGDGYDDTDGFDLDDSEDEADFEVNRQGEHEE